MLLLSLQCSNNILLAVYNTFRSDIKACFYYICCCDGKYRQNTKPRQTKSKDGTKRIAERSIANTSPEYTWMSLPMGMWKSHTSQLTLVLSYALYREIKQLPLPQSIKEPAVGKPSLVIPQQEY